MNITERKAMQLGNVPIIRLEMKWRTESNKYDCGIFAIRHMETYKGNGLRNWDCKFLHENEKVRIDISIFYVHNMFDSTME